MKTRTIFPAICILLVVGCGRHSTVRQNGALAVLRYPMSSDPASLDPWGTEWWGAIELLQNVYEPLVYLNAQNQIGPCLAVKWETSADGREYTFHLDKNARFHVPYSRPVTAADVKYSLERGLRPDTKSPFAASVLEDIVGASDVAAGKTRDLPGVQVIDPHIVKLTLLRPRGYFLARLASWVVCKEAIEKNGGKINERSMIGTGPFLLREYRHGSRISLEANRDYRLGKPQLDRIERPIIRDKETAHIMYENGELDLCDVALTDFAHDLKDPNFKAQAHGNLTPTTRMIVMHHRLFPPFRDIRVRRAFAMAINRDEIARIAYLGICPRVDGLVPPRAPGYNSAVRAIPYDPGKARTLLAEAGYPNGTGFPPLSLTSIKERPEQIAASQLMRDQLRQNLGIEINLVDREESTFSVDRYEQRMPFYRYGYTDIDPHGFISSLLRSNSPENFFGYNNRKFDALVEKADLETDRQKRLELYHAAEQIALDDVAVIPFVGEVEPRLYRPYVKDLDINCAGLMPHVHTRIAR